MLFTPYFVLALGNPLGDELVRILPDSPDAQGGALDRLPVGVLLFRAADARRPQVSFAYDRLVQVSLADNVGDGQPAARPQHPRRQRPRCRW
jgi:hypothetical protein